jgi:hypothetical protein
LHFNETTMEFTSKWFDLRIQPWNVVI